MLYAAFFVVLANAVVDVLYAAIDPGAPCAEAFTDDTGPLLDVRDLKVTFRSRRGLVTAVDGLSFSLGRSDVLGIVGESGSGKSVSS